MARSDPSEHRHEREEARVQAARVRGGDHKQRDEVVDEGDGEHECADLHGEAAGRARATPSANAVSVDIATPTRAQLSVLRLRRLLSQ
jgi:hypothetical protein